MPAVIIANSIATVPRIMTSTAKYLQVKCFAVAMGDEMVCAFLYLLGLIIPHLVLLLEFVKSLYHFYAPLFRSIKLPEMHGDGFSNVYLLSQRGAKFRRVGHPSTPVLKLAKGK